MKTFRAPLALALAVLVSCATRHHVQGADNPDVKLGRLAAVNPLDVAVLFPENLTGRADLPLEALRNDLQAGLIERRYSALALPYVDRATVDAAYRPGALGEQGVFQIAITGWDDTLWRSHARLIVDADVYLLDASAPERESALWGGHVTRRIELASQRAMTPHADALMKSAVAQLADGILDSLPPRNPERAN